jgi:hypothetical protein
VTEQPAPKFDFACKPAINGDEPLQARTDPHLSRHVLQHLAFARRRLKLRVWCETQPNCVAALAGLLEDECVRDHLENRVALVSIFLAGLLRFALLFWTM